MRSLFPRLSFIGLLVLATGCATSVDLNAVNRRIDDNAARIAVLEQARTKQDAEAVSARNRELKSLQAEVEALRKEFADSKWSVDNLTEKLESMGAYLEEVQQFMAQMRKKGPEMDKALEEMTNKLETEVRSLTEKLKLMLESESR